MSASIAYLKLTFRCKLEKHKILVCWRQHTFERKYCAANDYEL
jgi:hypothetical protein